MTPKPPENGHWSTSATEITFKWNDYLVRRDERAHGELLRTIDRFIRAEAHRLLVHQTDLAEEAAQEGLLGVERKIATLEMPDHPAAYVRKVVSNKVATLLQREASRRAREERYASPEMVEIDLTSGTDWHDFLETLRQAVNDDEFWTLVLRHHFDFSYDEIGELLEKQPGAIRQIALRGRRKACERMARLEGRVPAWLSLDVTDSPTEGATDRHPEATDSVDDPRRVSTESDVADSNVFDQAKSADLPRQAPPRQTRPTVRFDSPGESADTKPTARPIIDLGRSVPGPPALGPPALRSPVLAIDPDGPTPTRLPPQTNQPHGSSAVPRLAAVAPRLEAVVRQRLILGRRWLLRSPSSVVPIVILFAVPAVAQAPPPQSLAAGVESAVEVADTDGGTAGTARSESEVGIGQDVERPPAGPLKRVGPPTATTVFDIESPAGPKVESAAASPAVTVTPSNPDANPAPPGPDADASTVSDLDPVPPQTIFPPIAEAPTTTALRSSGSPTTATPRSNTTSRFSTATGAVPTAITPSTVRRTTRTAQPAPNTTRRPTAVTTTRTTAPTPTTTAPSPSAATTSTVTTVATTSTNPPTSAPSTTTGPEVTEPPPPMTSPVTTTPAATNPPATEPPPTGPPPTTPPTTPTTASTQPPTTAPPPQTTAPLTTAPQTTESQTTAPSTASQPAETTTSAITTPETEPTTTTPAETTTSTTTAGPGPGDGFPGGPTQAL